MAPANYEKMQLYKYKYKSAYLFRVLPLALDARMRTRERTSGLADDTPRVNNPKS